MNSSPLPPEVSEAFQRVPVEPRERLLQLRALVFEGALENEAKPAVQESLKWGEPSYVIPGGSAVRLGWKARFPGQVRMLFNCNTKLLDTFRELYPSTFSFEGKRAIVFAAGDRIPADELKHCITLALNYHRLKHLPLLGC